MTFGDRLKQLRTKHKMSQQALSDKLGIERSTIAKYETNVYEPKLSTLVQLSQLFGVSVDYLVAGKEFDNNADKDQLRARIAALEDTLLKIEQLIKDNR